MTATRSRASLYQKFLIPILLSTLGYVLIATLALSLLRSNMIDDRISKIRNLSEVALNVLNGFHQRALAGEFDQPTAQKLAKEALRQLRYDKTNYYFSYTYDGTCMLLPTLPEREGKNFIDLKDPNGFLFVKALIDNARTSHEPVFYAFPRSANTPPIPKAAITLDFEPWGWIIGTGIYIDDVDAQFRRTALLLAVVIIPVTLLIAGGTFYFVRTTVRELNQIIATLTEDANQVSTVTQQISQANLSLAESSSEQAASLEETVAAIEEISSMTKRNAESAHHARDLSAEARTSAETGVTRTNEMQTELEAIQAAGEEMRLAMDGIKASSDNVSQIIKKIDEIAFQTNILALNAAVEAARAGEAGTGFAVVAEEVRSLALRAANAAKETAEMIENSVKQSQKGVVVNDKVTERISGIVQKSAGLQSSLEEITKKTRNVDDLVSEIARGSEEQRTGLDQIAKAASEMDRATQQNAACAEENSGATEDLRHRADELRKAAASLMSLATGREVTVAIDDRPSALLPPKSENSPVLAGTRHNSARPQNKVPASHQ
ncbi:MAG: hypothetical protein B9S32_00525 [Verrucomicrobia bacterium Tous-C9LFEB]|nr:MAG: hypothetical protein B9S32_00525 [Verrucomicrobia bacterium Tous-C9LFEB]